MARAAERESLTLAGPAGSIEAILETPADSGARGTAVICHPHPQHGGTMHNKVVHTLARAANDVGLAALRFNFRGVGASEGSYDDGVGEQGDARAAVAWAKSTHDGPLLLAGFSFGSIVAIEVARHDAPAQLVSIAPPVGRIDRRDWSQPECPWLIVTGDEDELVDVDEVVEFVDSLDPGPELIVLPGVEHFFHGNLTRLRQTLVSHMLTAR